jgi:hypothetical protein
MTGADRNDGLILFFAYHAKKRIKRKITASHPLSPITHRPAEISELAHSVRSNN